MDLKDLQSKKVFDSTSSFNKYRNTEVLSRCQVEARFNGVYSRDNLPKK